MSFQDLGVLPEIISVLKRNGINSPTAIQTKAIPEILNGEDIIGKAQTGTGKTLAFLIPIFQNIDENSKHVQSLIVAPTRELAIQITNEAEKLKGDKNIKILSAYGGKDIGAQLKKLNKDIHIVVATPGRLIDHLLRGTIDLSKVKTMVVDEADQMLLMGFKNEIEDIISKTPKNRQVLFFSATLDSNVKKLAYRMSRNPVEIEIESKKLTLDKIDQEVVKTTDREKQDALSKVLKEDNPFMGIIFCRTKRRADELEEGLYKRGFDIQKIHSDILQSKRERIMKSFRNGDFQFLIATDVASRGLDISGVSNVYNYDMPETVEAYIHRIGRTGRAGETGYTCLFVTKRDEEMFEKVEKGIRKRIKVRNID